MAPARTRLHNKDGHVRPFLKWAGNKYQIIDRIRQQLPQGRRLIEPFVGSGAVFVNTRFDNYLLCDNNPDLIHLYTLLQEEGERFIRYCKRLFTGEYNNAESFYQHRERFNQSRNKRQRAALFLYLNRHGYNGLCRYNASGGFNVPFGRYAHPYFPEMEMCYFHEKSANTEFRLAGFEESFASAQPGDVIYCDPPYVPLSSSANFTSYSAGGFDLDQQQHLADLAEASARKGIPVLISNHNTPFTRKAYGQADRLIKFKVNRFISCKGENREDASELLAMFDGI